MNQKLVTKKNRKLRQLRALYPDIKCKVFYQRDYLHLLVKYGLDEPGNQDLPGGTHPGTRTAADPGPRKRGRRRSRRGLRGETACPGPRCASA